MAEWSKNVSQVMGTILRIGVGSNPTTELIFLAFLFFNFINALCKHYAHCKYQQQ